MSTGWVAAGVGALGILSGRKSASSAQKAQEKIAREAQASQDKLLEQQIRQGDEMLAFNKQVYEEQKGRLGNLDALNREVVDLNMDIARKDAARADESYQFYQNKGRPMVERAFEDASTYDSESNLRNVSQEAKAGVQRGFDNAQAQNTRMLQRMGIAPNAGKFAALNNKLMMDKVAAIAGADRSATEQRRAGGIQLRQQAANLAQGFPAQSLAQGAQASGASATGSNVGGNTAAVAGGMAGQAMNGMAAGTNVYGNVGNAYANRAGMAYNNINNMAAINANNQAGWGNLVGWGLNTAFRSGWGAPGGGGAQLGYSNAGYADMFGGGPFADGGVVNGPGTGTSDSVPAVNADTGQRIQLSNGEFVIPADVVKKLGTEHFEKMIERHHKPKNLRGGE